MFSTSGSPVSSSVGGAQPRLERRSRRHLLGPIRQISWRASSPPGPYDKEVSWNATPRAVQARKLKHRTRRARTEGYTGGFRERRGLLGRGLVGRLVGFFFSTSTTRD